MSDAGAITALLMGLGALAILGMVAYFMFQIARLYRGIADKEEAYENVEEAALDKMATNLGIQVEEFLTKREVRNTKTFKRALEQRMIEELLSKKENNGGKKNG